MPSFEEFQQFGAANAYQDLYTPQAQDISAQTTQAITLGAGVAFAVVGTTAAALIGSTLSFATIAAIFPYSGVTLTLSASGIYFSVGPAAGASSGAIGASAAAGPAAAIILALTVAIIQGINIGNEAALPGKLQEAINTAQNQTINLRDLTTTDSGNSEIYGAFLMATLPDFPGTDVPAPAPTDRKFEVSTQNSSGATISDTISYQDWDGNCHTARLSGAWFVDSKNGVEAQALRIRFRNWDNENWIASRNGGQFFISKADDPYNTKLVDELPFRDCGSVNRGAKIKFEQMTVLSRGTTRVPCGGIVQNPDPGKNFEVGSISSAGDAPGQLTVTVNGGATATVNNVTVRNLSVTSDYKIMANVTFQNAATPTEAQFTVTVRNTVAQVVSASFSVQKSAIIDTFPLTMPTNLSVGDNFNAQIDPGGLLISCYSFNYSVSSGALPPGVTLQTDQFNGVSLVGTLQSGGKFVFELSKIYTNGEVLKHSYVVFVKSDLTAMPNNLVSWWRAENDAEDFTGAHKGTLVGSVSYDNGKVNRAFKFDGANGYIALPNDTFSPSLDFTFELWFKTAERGVILGRQRAVVPYDTPSYGTTPAIYVDQNGKLKVQMFRNQTNTFTTSGTRVDNNAFHHVAVTYNRASNVRTVYLDGVNIGTVNLGQSAESNNKYQLGTGYVNDGLANGMNGWFNFNGLVDEPTLYNRALTETEIKNIFAAGDAGKISINILATPPLTRDAANASITIYADGGAPPLNYSIDGGTTFQNTNSFVELTAGNYTIVVKDGNDRTITRQVAINNPPPTLNLTTSQTNPTCDGAQTGEIRIYPTGGSGNYEYSVLNGANIQTSNVFTQLNGGTYTLWIRDVASNTIYTGATITLSQPAPISVSPTSFVNAQINQAYSQTFSIAGGTAPFTVTASGGNPNNGGQIPAGLNASADANSLTISGTPTVAGTFPILLEINDQNGCTAVRNFPLAINSDTNATYTISGRATNGGQGLQDVSIALNGANRYTTTDASGNFSFTNVAGGVDYTVAASLNGVTFTQATLAYNNLSANIADVNFTTAATTFEGDIFPRNGNDGLVNVSDLVTLGRIIGNLDRTPFFGGEWQRTDIAASLGDGLINEADLTQLGHYVVRLDALRPATGPAYQAQSLIAAKSETTKKSFENSLFSEQTDDLTKNMLAPAAANLSAGSVSATSTNAVVPVSLGLGMDTAAIQFTVIYDPAKLSIPSDAAIINRYTNATFVINNDTPGKLSIVSYRPLDGASVFPASTTKLFDINFTVVSGASGTTAVGFGNDPVPQIASNPQALPFSISSSGGTVTLLAPTAASVSFGGRVLSGSRGVMNAVVTLTDQFGAPRQTRTNFFGYYRFTEVPAGAIYIVNVKAKGHQFAPQVRNINEDIADFNFSALP